MSILFQLFDTERVNKSNAFTISMEVAVAATYIALIYSGVQIVIALAGGMGKTIMPDVRGDLSMKLRDAIMMLPILGVSLYLLHSTIKKKKNQVEQ